MLTHMRVLFTSVAVMVVLGAALPAAAQPDVNAQERAMRSLPRDAQAHGISHGLALTVRLGTFPQPEPVAFTPGEVIHFHAHVTNISDDLHPWQPGDGAALEIELRSDDNSHTLVKRWSLPWGSRAKAEGRGRLAEWYSRLGTVPSGRYTLHVRLIDGAYELPNGKPGPALAIAPLKVIVGSVTLADALAAHRTMPQNRADVGDVRLLVAHDGSGRAPLDPLTGRLSGMLVNDGNRPIQVAAYASFTADGELAFPGPLCLLHDTDRYLPVVGFRSLSLGWCGTGAAPCVIEPGSRRRVTLSAREPGILRFRVTYTEADAEGASEHFEVVSKPVQVIDLTFEEIEKAPDDAGG